MTTAEAAPPVPAVAVEPQTTRSLEETARFFDVSAPTVRAWIGDGCPVVAKGSNGVAYQLDLRAVHAWRADRSAVEQRDAERRAEQDRQLRLELLGGDALSVDEGGALSAKARADALAAEVQTTKLRQLRGELVSADEVKLAVTQALAALSTKLRTIPDLLAVEFGLSDEQAERMVEMIDDQLEDAAETLDALAAANGKAA